MNFSKIIRKIKNNKMLHFYLRRRTIISKFWQPYFKLRFLSAISPSKPSLSLFFLCVRFPPCPLLLPHSPASRHFGRTKQNRNFFVFNVQNISRNFFSLINCKQKVFKIRYFFFYV